MQNKLDESIAMLNEQIESLGECLSKSRLPHEGAVDDDGMSRFIKSGDGPSFSKSMTSANNAYLIPNKTCTYLREKMSWTSPIRSLASSIQISSDALELLIDGKLPEACWSSETEFPEKSSDPEFRKIKIPVHEVFARIKATQHLLDDSSVNIYEWFTTKIASQIARLEDDAFLNGDGNGKPRGILSYPTQPKTHDFGVFQHYATGKTDGFKDNSGADILIKVVASLENEYKKNATWVMSRSALRCIQLLKDSSGRYLLQQSLEASPPTLLGFPIVVDENVPELGEVPSTAIIFGDFSRAYQIVDRNQINVLRDQYSSKPFIEFYATKRTGGDVVNFAALKMVRFGI